MRESSWCEAENQQSVWFGLRKELNALNCEVEDVPLRFASKLFDVLDGLFKPHSRSQAKFWRRPKDLPRAACFHAQWDLKAIPQVDTREVSAKMPKEAARVMGSCWEEPMLRLLVGEEPTGTK